MRKRRPRSAPARFPVIYDGAEHVVRGYLQRRNILTFLPPRGYEGYDILVVHPDPRAARRALKIQVKSRLDTDSRNFMIKRASVRSADYFAFVVMAIGHFRRRKEGLEEHPELYLVPCKAVERRLVLGGMRGDRLGFGASLKHAWRRYKGQRGIERIATRLGVPVPRPPRSVDTDSAT